MIAASPARSAEWLLIQTVMEARVASTLQIDDCAGYLVSVKPPNEDNNVTTWIPHRTARQLFIPQVSTKDGVRHSKFALSDSTRYSNQVR